MKTSAQFSSLKIGIVGCGKVGMTVAYTMLLDGTPSEIVLYNRDLSKIVGEKLDLEHAMPFLDTVKITATDSFQDLAGCHMIFYTAGSAQKPGDTRLDLVDANIAILESILPKIVEAAPNAIIVMIANPVDVMTYHANKMFPQMKGKIFGSGTLLDTARFRFHLSEIIGVNSHNIHAYILGEHGDSSFPVYAYATAGGKPLMEYDRMNRAMVFSAFERAKNAAYEIIKSKGATYYAIGVVAKRIAQMIFSDAKAILPLSMPLDGEFGIQGVSLSLPRVIGAQGIERTILPNLSAEERLFLEKSAETLQQYCKS